MAIARYDGGLSKFETRWGTFTDPWTHQPQPKCGFVIVGTEGTISSYDGEKTVRMQTRACTAGADVPVDALPPAETNPIRYLLDRLERDLPIEGPLDPAISRIGQRIVDAAVKSTTEGRTVSL